jgi:epoxyqueuosine reductase
MIIDKADMIKEQELIRIKALELGFVACGFSKADILREELAKFLEYLKMSYNGDMAFLEKNIEKRFSPALLVENAKTVISLLTNYYPSERQKGDNIPLISVYAYGKDYHKVIKERLNLLFEYIKQIFNNKVQGRFFVDTAPVLEKAWAAKSGLGWIGKNGLLITPDKGSFNFISEIIIDYEFKNYDKSIENKCGDCNKCIEACPTGALETPYVLDARKCISYLTIEYKGILDEYIGSKIGKYAYGCDICQNVCPWNKFAKPHNDIAFAPHSRLFSMTASDWEKLTENEFKDIFKQTPIARIKYKRFKELINLSLR